MRQIKALIVVGFCFLFANLSYAQRGKDGAKTIAASGTIVNEYTTLTADAASGSTSITVANSSLNANNRFASSLGPGDLVMIIQLQGASLNATINPWNSHWGYPTDTTWGAITNYNNCGNYEFDQVKDVPNGTTIDLSCALSKSYTDTGKVEVVRVPRLSTLTINSGASVTAPAWDGSTGGIVAVEVLDSTVINSGGSIDVSSDGFRGAQLNENLSEFGGGQFAADTATEGAEKGEGIGGYETGYYYNGGFYCRGAAGNAGGGGDAHNAGGGGGANAGDTSMWHGTGIPDLSTANWANAWNLEYNGFATSTSTGGGRGGYSSSLNVKDPLTLAPGNTNWGGDYRRSVGGFGGRPLDYSTGKIFFGGGGGSGDQDDNYGGAGGAGGGIVYMLCYGNISGAGQIVANGQDGFASTGNPPLTGQSGTDGAGGAGAGGTVILNTTGLVSGITVHADGGKGGDQDLQAGNPFTTIKEAEGPGGGGGGGYIALSNGTVTQTANGGANGLTNSPTMTNFMPNGATKGGDGLTNQTINPSDAIVALTALNDTICPGNTATLNASFVGTPPAGTSIIWYDASVGGNVIGMGTSFTTPILNADTTFYVGTCPGTGTQAVSVIISSSFTASAGNNTSICKGTNTQLNATGGSSYSWSPAASLSNANIANPVASPTVTTTYTVTITSSGGCSTQDSVTVNVNPPPTANAGSNQAICQGTSAQLNASGGTNYSWGPVAGLSNDTIANPTASPNATTTYTVTVSDSLGCSSMDSVTVTVNPTPVASAGADSTICNGTSAQLNASGGVSYSWTPSASLSDTAIANPVASPGVSTTYTVMVANASGCKSSDSITVNVDTLPHANAGTDQTICQGSSTQLNASGGTAYSWSPSAGLSDTAIANPTANPTATTTYIVTVNDSIGCSSQDSVTVNVGAALTVNAGADQVICPGDSAQLNASVGSTVAYLWSPGTGLSNDTIANPKASPSATTTYVVTATDPGGCQGTDTVVVNVNPLVNLALQSSSTTICPGANDTLTALVSGGSMPYSYHWNQGLADTTQQVVNPSSMTVYTVYATDNNGCSTTQQTDTVNVYTPVTVAASVNTTTICQGATVTLSATASGGTGSGYTYNWGTAGTGSPLTVTPSSSVTYTVSVADNCSASPAKDSVMVTVNPLPVVTFSSDVTAGCPTLCVNFSNSTAGTINSTAWNFGDGATSTSANPQHCYTNSGSYDVSLTCTDANGCTASKTLTGQIVVYAQPVAGFSVSPSSGMLINQPLTFTDSSHANISSWQWTFGDTTLAVTTQNAQHTYQNTGHYCVMLKVSDASGCVDSTTSCYDIGENNPLIAPNVFTPNQDGKNDYFVFKGLTGTDNHLVIFDRWGNKVYESNSYANNWDASNLSDGVYYYILTTTKGDKKDGYVQVLKKNK